MHNGRTDRGDPEPSKPPSKHSGIYSHEIEGIVLLQKGEQSLPALAALKTKVHELNTGNLLPPMREALRLDPKNAAVLEPQQSGELTALAARGLRLNPAASACQVNSWAS